MNVKNEIPLYGRNSRAREHCTRSRLRLNELVAACSIMLASLTVHAAPDPCSDSFGYRCEDKTSNFVPTTAAPLALTDGQNPQQVTLAFPFKFYGQTYERAWVSTNGFISFSSATDALQPRSIPDNTEPNGAIYAFWNELIIDLTTSKIAVETRGVAPERVMVFEWYNARLRERYAENRISAQILLHEATGEILLQYSGIDESSASDNGSIAGIGIENQTGTVGIQYSNGMPVLSNGLAIRFIPPPPPDTAGPVITINAPANGAEYKLYQAAASDYSCADLLSGLISCVGAVASGGPIDTTSVGTKSFTVTASDNQRNSSTLTNAYRVTYEFTGFFAPVDNSTETTTVLNQTRAGNSVPVRFSLKGNQGFGIFGPNSPASKQVSCTEGSSSYPLEEIATPGSSGLAYDAATDHYHYVWKTDKSWAGTCRVLILTLNDGTEHKAYFEFKN